MQSVRRAWQGLATRWAPFKAAMRPDDLAPDRLRSRVVYVLGNPGWRVVFLCPCGCRETVELCLLESFQPHWLIFIDEVGRVTLSPSVWNQVGCQSHYFIRQGRLIWV